MWAGLKYFNELNTRYQRPSHFHHITMIYNGEA